MKTKELGDGLSQVSFVIGRERGGLRGVVKLGCVGMGMMELSYKEVNSFHGSLAFIDGAGILGRGDI